MIKFSELPISSRIVRAVRDMGFETATEIQEKAIPIILQGRDVLGKSNTGTGKTAAFGIPAIETAQPLQRHPGTLILCPTRELVLQVSSELRKFAKYKEGIRVTPVYGGEPIDYQIQQLKKGSAIVVGTPGRIMDHLHRRTLRLSELNMMILDEADEMLNMGFKEDIETILKSVPEDRHHQTILFSATWPEAILKITQEFQDDPVKVEISSTQRTIDTIAQSYYEVPKGQKDLALEVLLEMYRPSLCMIFCNTKKMVDELSETLGKAGYQSSCLHGDIKQETRTKVMNQFRSGAFPILIATDVAARGIDVDDVDLVINYDLPQDDEYYIHRVGRTGRAGKSGEAVTLIYPAQRRDLSRVISYTKADIRRKQFPDSEQLKAFSRRRFIDEISEACRKGSDDDTIALTYELMAQGIAPFNLISTLIAMNYRPKDLDTSSLIKAQRRQKERMRTLSLSLGKQDGIRTGHVVAAIIEASGIDADAIGAVHIHNRSTSVDIAAEQIDLVVKKMKKAKIRGKNVRVSREEKAEKEPAQKKRAENGKKKNRSSESLKKKKFRKTKKEKQ